MKECQCTIGVDTTLQTDLAYPDSDFDGWEREEGRGHYRDDGD
jgi:hypothetical protein